MRPIRRVEGGRWEGPGGGTPNQSQADTDLNHDPDQIPETATRQKMGRGWLEGGPAACGTGGAIWTVRGTSCGGAAKGSEEYLDHGLS